MEREYYKIKEYYRIKEIQKAAIAFKWKSEQIKIPRNIEAILAEGGSIGYALKEDKWYMGQFTGQTDDLNEFTEYVGVSLSTNRETKTFKNNDEIIVCGNNSFYLPDTPLFDWYSGFAEDIDISMYFQLINSRNIPALIADSDQKAKQIQKAFEKIKAGVPVVITTDIFDNTEALDLTDKSLIEKMQYITSFNADITKRYSNMRGIDVNTLDKRAQVTSEELRQFDDVVSDNFLVMYESRLDFVERMKAAGIEIEVIRNPIYKDEAKEEEIDDPEAQEEALKEETTGDISGQEETTGDNKGQDEIKEEDKEDETV